MSSGLIIFYCLRTLCPVSSIINWEIFQKSNFKYLVAENILEQCGLAILLQKRENLSDIHVIIFQTEFNVYNGCLIMSSNNNPGSRGLFITVYYI